MRLSTLSAMATDEASEIYWDLMLSIKCPVSSMRINENKWYLMRIISYWYITMLVL